MTSSHLTGENSGIDPVEALRPLMAELRGLVDRLDLPDEGAALARSLHEAQEQVAGPRAVVMLLGEREDLKRQFLERLLGPGVVDVPAPTAVCTWLEYGETAECTVTMPLGMTAVFPLAELDAFPGERAMLSIRLPNLTLQGGPALIDTPAAERGSPDERALECIAHADAWIYVLGGDYALSESGEAWLAHLPDHGERLELVVENGSTLGDEARAEARERLMQTLKERCGIAAPRLTVVTADESEDDEQNVWHGRFATFHSVMLLRGREHWLEKTRAAVGEALSKVELAIGNELSSTLPGPQQAKLRMGLKDAQALSSRFRGAQAGSEAATQNSLGGIWSGAHEATNHHPPLATLAEAMAAALAPESAEAAEPAAIPPRPPAEEAAKAESLKREPAEALNDVIHQVPEREIPVSMEQAFGIPSPADKAKTGRRVTVHFTGGVGRFLRDSRFLWWRRAIGIAFAILLLCLVLWALSPRGFFYAHEQPGDWEYHPPPPAPPAAVLAADGDEGASPAQPATPLPDAMQPGTPGLHATPLAKPSAAMRMPLAKPVPTDARAGAAPMRHRHRHLLGLGKLWHWIHPSRSKTTED